MKTVVVGGGVAGLAAGYALAKQGHGVTLFEAGPILGGQVRTFEIGGGRIESFYHHIFRSDTEIIALLEELGLGDELDWIESKGAMNSEGRNYPFVGPLDLLRFDRVSLLTRVRLGLVAMWLRRTSDWRGYEGVRASEWIRSRVGREGYERVWAPLLRAKFGPYAEDISMAWFWGKIYLRFASRDGGLLAKERLGYLRGSFGQLVDALAAAIAVRGGELATSAPVERVLIEDGRVVGVEVSSEGGAGRARRVDADVVLAMVPSGVFAGMVPELELLDPEYSRLLGETRYQWASVLVLTLDRPLSEHYWLTMTDEDCPFVVAVEQTNFVSPETYGGRHVLYLSNYTSPNDPIIELDADEVFEWYEPYLRRINPNFDSSWVTERWLFVDRAGQPIVHSKYHEGLVPHRTAVAGLYLANTTQIYPEDRGQNYSIRMGQRVAELARIDAGERAAEDSPIS